MRQKYERTLRVRGSELKIEADGEVVTAHHNDALMARRVGDVGLLVFTAIERGERVDYDIAVLRSGGVTRIFVGRKGVLVYSDDPAMLTDRLSEL